MPSGGAAECWSRASAGEGTTDGLCPGAARRNALAVSALSRREQAPLEHELHAELPVADRVEQDHDGVAVIALDHPGAPGRVAHLSADLERRRLRRNDAVAGIAVVAV